MRCCGFLKVGCDVMDMSVSMPNINSRGYWDTLLGKSQGAPKCQRFSKGIKNYNVKKKENSYRHENRQAEVVKTLKDWLNFDNRYELDKEFNSRMSKCTDRLDPDDENSSKAYRKCSSKKWAKDFQKKIKLMEDMINHLASKEPILFAKAENSKSIFRQWTKYTNGKKI